MLLELSKSTIHTPTTSLSIMVLNRVQCCTHSDYFPVNRGVKQGSLLPPTLFIAVMDPLLSYLESSGLGLSVSGLSVGSSPHGDDIRAASIGIDAVRTQGNLVDHFCKANSLKLNATKTELVKFSHKKPDHVIAGQEIQVQANAKCLGT